MPVNSVVIIGNLTRDAELKYFNNGNAIVKFSIAQNRRKKQGDEWVDEAQFFDVSYGGKGAEGVHKYLTKGKTIGVQGELRQDRWEKDGQNHSKVYISAFEVQLLGGRDAPSNGSQETMPGKFASDGKGSTDERFEDDIPF